jgi:hypothetical protein
VIFEWYVGFFRPYLRNAEGYLTVRGIFGHCEIWGCTDDGTWLFMDPQSRGTRICVEHRLEDVQRHLHFRLELCDLILRLPADEPTFRLPIFGPMTCAAICGHITGVRALLPRTLKRRLLAKGAEVVHGQSTKGKPTGASG